jgi:predicted dehydrogenase
MAGAGKVRWGIIGTANIARTEFLPGLRAAGGVAAVVAGRDLERASQYARDHGIDRAVAGYRSLIEDPGVDAVYIPLPNSFHAGWTIRALRAGKPVLCETPLCGSVAEAELVTTAARETGTLLWEAFVFPFHAQFERIRGLLAEGVIGELREIQSNFHFRVREPRDIGLSRNLEGGAVNDVGCYPVRLARELFAADHTRAVADAVWGGEGVDVETWGILDFPGGRRLLLSCGFRRAYDTFTRLQGTEGQIHLTNPFHPGPGDRFEVFGSGARAGLSEVVGDEPSFAAAIRHINAVLMGESAPRMLAVDTSLGTARALRDLAASATAVRA